MEKALARYLGSSIQTTFAEACCVCGLAIVDGTKWDTEFGVVHKDCYPILTDEEKRRNQWVQAGERFGCRANKLREAYMQLQWEIGDWLLVGEKNGYISSGMYEAASEITGYKTATLEKFAYVARRFPVCIRMQNVQWAVHQMVAPVETEDERKAMLTRLVDGPFSRDSVREIKRRLDEIKREQKIAGLKPVAEAEIEDNPARLQLEALFDAADACGEAFELDLSAMLAAIKLDGRKKAAIKLRAAAAKLIECAELVEANDPIKKTQNRARKKRQRHKIVRVN